MNRGRELDPARLEEHLDRLFRAAWALCGSRQEAEDLVQETCARVLARPRYLRGDDRAYLLRALHNVHASMVRADRRRAPARPLDTTLAPTEDGTARQPHDAAEARLLYETIAALPADFRATLVAVDIIGLSYAEAALALGVRQETITTRLFRARRRVARSIDGPSAEAPGRSKGSVAARLQ